MRTDENRPHEHRPEQISRRGIAPSLLLSQVRNTAPFLFTEERAASDDEPHLALLRRAASALERSPFQENLLFNDHFSYFELCLAAHHATVATFVPTDVDNHIRFKLWHPSLPLETIIAMVEL